MTITVSRRALIAIALLALLIAGAVTYQVTRNQAPAAPTTGGQAITEHAAINQCRQKLRNVGGVVTIPGTEYGNPATGGGWVIQGQYENPAFPNGVGFECDVTEAGAITSVRDGLGNELVK